ncbi:MarR family winged helix-turn-helix transcriptional regulator [Euzebya tangerina]|uniref:MarR family winged helix-turn-helix transcriptional regulator n=1 Tax=Euzebya tangerina TaxID=591198 RepID=UPI000E320F9D|nr:MarR family transcriptional regulator [Euzebya tangerina]
MANATPRPQRQEFEETVTDGTQLSWALRSVLWAYDDVQQHVADLMDLSERDVRALEHLMERPDLGPADLALLLGISTASSTVLVDRLEDAGHIRRQPHPEDRRRKQLVVTQHASDEMLANLRPLFDMLKAIDDDFDEHEKAVIESYLRKVTDVYGRFTA